MGTKTQLAITEADFLYQFLSGVLARILPQALHMAV